MIGVGELVRLWLHVIEEEVSPGTHSGLRRAACLLEDELGDVSAAALASVDIEAMWLRYRHNGEDFLTILVVQLVLLEVYRLGTALGLVPGNPTAEVPPL